jgi:ribosomal RNA assembly protein
MEYIKVAEDRIGAVIGKDGEVKSMIEEVLEVKLDVNSREMVVKIENVGSDPLAEWNASDVVKAISYGILPKTALQLKSDENVLAVINISDIVGRSKKAIIRQRGRIIGREGKTKKHIAGLSDTSIAIKGKHIAIVGKAEEVALAREAVEAVIGGLPHSVVYKVLEKKCASLKKQRNIDMWNNR